MAQTRTSYDAGSAFISLNAATTTGIGNEVVFLTRGNGELPYGFTWQVIHTGGATTVTLTLQSSLDGVNWADIDTATGSAKAVEVRSVASAKALMLRANLATLTGGTSPTVTVLIAA